LGALVPTRSAADTHAPDSAAEVVPHSRDLGVLAAAARDCQACPAAELGGHAVFGEGPADAGLCLIGEQPGDQEDKQGHPFVGPAGHVLDRALAQAGIERDSIYLTNAVKHFVFVWRGKRRLHSKPGLRVQRACKPWLEAELAALSPRVIVCLGATAAQALFGPRFSVLKNRGQPLAAAIAPDAQCVVTYHPSALLRMDTAEAKEQAFDELVSDLRLAQRLESKVASPRRANAKHRIAHSRRI
jgi:uracil-DNA glycosylase family protein